MPGSATALDTCSLERDGSVLETCHSRGAWPARPAQAFLSQSTASPPQREEQTLLKRPDSGLRQLLPTSAPRLLEEPGVLVSLPGPTALVPGGLTSFDPPGFRV